MRFRFTLLVLAISLCLAEKIRYDDYKVYRLIPNDEESFNVLKDLEKLEGVSEFKFFKSAIQVGGPVDILVPPHKVDIIQDLGKLKGINSSLLMDNVQKYIDNQGLRSQSRVGSFDWSSYHTFDEYNTFLLSLAESYPDTVTLLHGGSTYEGRDILGVRVSFSSANQNRGVFLESLIHAREWIAGAVTTYVLNEVLTSTDPEFRSFVEGYDWYVFPVANPDGFEYTQTTDRLWRKTRTPYGDGCYGVDPNRNWGYQWNTGGASDSPCDEAYCGPTAFSDATCKSLSEFISGVGDRLVAYFAFHSYSQLLLIPYGHTAEHLDNYDVTYPIGVKAAEALAARYGTSYQVGNLVEILYVASGGSMDWVKGTFGTPLVYTYELRDQGEYGFLLPAEQIIPTALETLDSLLTILREYENTK